MSGLYNSRPHLEWKKNRWLYVAPLNVATISFLDASKAFDLVNRDILFNCLSERKVSLPDS